jgi:hypothetical protein
MFSFEMLILSFGGGVFGAAIGGLPSFVLCGVCATIGLAIFWATGEDTFLNLTAWGPLLGPHIAFAGGVAAAAYAAKVGKLKSGGKDIVSSLMGLNAPDVLIVGGVFGMLGYVLNWLAGLLPALGGFPFTNGPSIAIIVSAMIVRLLFGKTGLFGKVRKGDNCSRPSDVAAWLPWQSKPEQLILIAIGWGLPISFFIRVMPELFTFGFALAAVALVFLGTGSTFPVFHHIGIMAGMATLASGGNVWWGLTFALVAAFLGEFFAVRFLCHADTHIDPPAFAVFVTWTIVALLSTTTLFNLSGVVPIIVAVVVAVLGYVLFKALQKEPHQPRAEEA